MNASLIRKYLPPAATGFFVVLFVAIMALRPEIREDTSFVFVLVPAVLFFCLSLGVIGIGTLIVTELVMLGIWLGRLLEGDAPDVVPYYFYLALIAAVLGCRVADLANHWWNRAEAD